MADWKTALKWGGNIVTLAADIDLVDFAQAGRMAKEQEIFKKMIADSWRIEFPFFKPVVVQEVPQVPTGCNFLRDQYCKERNRFYFLRLRFSAKRRGKFSLGLTVSQTPNKSILAYPRLLREPSPTTEGMFSIWKLMKRPRYAWALVDLEVESEAQFAKLGITTIDFGRRQSPNIWRPTTYDQPFDGIAKEAISHVNKTIRTTVFTILQIGPK